LAIRCQNLLLRAHGQDSVAGVVEWFGAMQAQDLNSGLWSLGHRLPSWTVDDVQAALERREAVRTWPMRGTVHLVPARDARWMVEFLGARPLAAAERRRQQIGLSEGEADKAVVVLEEALAGGNRLTRADCVSALESAGIDGAGQRAYHLLWYTSQKGVTCIAPNIGNEQTFVLLSEWVPDPVRLSRDEALTTIARRYFRSHGPATLRDFAGWTGITMGDARRGVSGCGDSLAAVDCQDIQMLAETQALADCPTAPLTAKDLWLLPGFDEYLLGFKDRSLMLDAEHKEAILPGGNGVFRSTLVRAGRVIGTWKRTLTKTRVQVQVDPFKKPSAQARRQAEVALDAYATYLGRSLEVSWQK
jgi:hypothetical protein